MKKRVCSIVFLFISADRSRSLSCATEIPVIYDRYEGYSGKQHGEMNDKIPAPNASQTLNPAMISPPITT
jgi:hypothetical protein